MSPSMSSSEVSSVPIVCVRLTDLGPVRALVGEVTEVLVFEALNLAVVSRLPLAINGLRFAAGWSVVIILSKDDGAWGCA